MKTCNTNLYLYKNAHISSYHEFIYEIVPYQHEFGWLEGEYYEKKIVFFWLAYKVSIFELQ